MKLFQKNKVLNGLFILLIFLVSCSNSNVNTENLATDSQLIWCLSQEKMVDIGSVASATGWDKLKDTITNESFSESVVIEAKEIYNTLITTIDFYEYVQPSKFHPEILFTEKTKTKQDHKVFLKTTFIEGELYDNQVDLFFLEMKSAKSRYESDKFFRKNDKEYNEALKENREAEYVNSHSICKLWYEVNN